MINAIFFLFFIIILNCIVLYTDTNQLCFYVTIQLFYIEFYRSNYLISFFLYNFILADEFGLLEILFIG